MEYHLAEQKILESTIPSNIGIGPFHILTESVRQGLSKKRKALANSMLELLARRLRKQAEDACEEFKGRSDISDIIESSLLHGDMYLDSLCRQYGIAHTLRHGTV